MKFFPDNELRNLIQELKNGNEEAFNSLYARFFKSLYCKFFSMVKDENVARELIQELFLKLWQNRRELKLDTSFHAYIYKIARNLVYDYFRKVAKDSRLTQMLIKNATEYYLQSDELLESKEARQILMRAIDQLSPQRKLVFTYCKLDGKSYEDASRELGISVATVNSHMTYSLRFIREYLRKNINEASCLLIFYISYLFKS